MSSNLIGAQMDIGIINLFGKDINMFAISIIMIGIYLFFSMVRSQKTGQLNWSTLISHNGKNVSTTKLLQLLGGIFASWIVVKMALMTTLTWDFFAIYLAYVASIDGYNKFILSKFNPGSSTVSTNKEAVNNEEQSKIESEEK